MIETVMIFALGFLSAALCALFVLPAVNARAARLARRRTAALFPLTSVEIAAEKDYLRAQFAVERRQLERRVQAVGATKHADMATIGARTLEAAALARTVTEREAAMAVKDGEIAKVQNERDQVAVNLGTTQADLAVGISTLQVLEDAHRHLLDDLLKQRRSDEVVAAASPDPGKMDAADAVPASAGETPPPGAEARIATLMADAASLRARLAAAEAALSSAGAERENAALRDSIAAVADALVRGERLPSVGAFPLRAGAHDPS